jgi:DNA-binding XRE family transcriptional regulator
MLDSNRLCKLIGERVKQIRETQTPRLSQQDLADILGLTRTSVTNMERGNQKPTLDTMYRLCEHFRLEIQELIPTVAEITRTEPRSIVVGGQSHEIGSKTASAVNRLRPAHGTRR